MTLTQDKFNRILMFASNHSTVETAKFFKISDRQVQRIKEAGTWERWPYIQAKVSCGYMTPEYKLYLKRRGLPITPPAKTVIIRKEKASASTIYALKATAQPEKRSWWRRLLGL